MASEWHGSACPECGLGTLHDAYQLERRAYRGKIYESRIGAAICDKCGDGMAIYDEDEEQSWVQFKTTVDSNYARDIAAWRIALELTQKEAAEIVGGGVNSFSRYERGEAKPAVAAINLFGLLNKYPHLVSELLIGAVVRDGYKKVSTFTVPRRTSQISAITECANDAYVGVNNVFDLQQMQA